MKKLKKLSPKAAVRIRAKASKIMAKPDKDSAAGAAT